MQAVPLWYAAAGAIAHALLPWAPLRGKAALWRAGQAEAWAKLAAFKRTYAERPFWFHAASLGEFEQAKPVLLALRKLYPGVPVVVTFFSASGYEARKHFAEAELVCYLPLDAGSQPRHFVEALQPRAVFWVKYDFWLGYLSALRQRGVPTFLLGAWPKPHYFSGLKTGYYRRAYGMFSQIFLQYPEALTQMPADLRPRCIVTGDPRFDNVLTGVAQAAPIPELEAFRAASDKPVLLVGSAWPQDTDILLPALARLGQAYRLLIFPHEMHADYLDALQAQISGRVARWSAGVVPEADALIVDRVGFLARAYRYGDVAWVGGAFGKGLHNILEACAWGKPVVHGPKTGHFPEAGRLAEAGGGFAVADEASANAVLQQLLDPNARARAGQAALAFAESQRGATDRILASVGGDT